MGDGTTTDTLTPTDRFEGHVKGVGDLEVDLIAKIRLARDGLRAPALVRGEGDAGAARAEPPRNVARRAANAAAHIDHRLGRESSAVARPIEDAVDHVDLCEG